MERPGLRMLLTDVSNGLVDVIVVYKIDRLTRSLADFSKMVEVFEAKGVSFVSVTQQFNTTTSMGRLTLNVLLSFAQFEREVTAERIRDKIAASRRKGLWMGGPAKSPRSRQSHVRTITRNSWQNRGSVTVHSVVCSRNTNEYTGTRRTAYVLNVRPGEITPCFTRSWSSQRLTASYQRS
jgi:DNA invertase Pin-like site-specific DNA recombinase